MDPNEKEEVKTTPSGNVAEGIEPQPATPGASLNDWRTLLAELGQPEQPEQPRAEAAPARRRPRTKKKRRRRTRKRKPGCNSVVVQKLRQKIKMLKRFNFQLKRQLRYANSTKDKDSASD